jgi:hypothetical protein
LFFLLKAALGKAVLGIHQNDSKISLASSETNFFNDFRYGYGHARLVVGESNGVKMRSAGGGPLINTGDFFKDDFGALLAVEFGNVAVNWTFNEEEVNHYTLMPGAGAGLYGKINGTIDAILVAKSGGAISNYFKRKFLRPDIYHYVGYQATLAFKKYGVNYDKIYFHGEFVESIGAFYDSYSFRFENGLGEKNFVFLVDLL